MPSPTYSIQNIMSVHYSLSVPNHIHLYAYASVYCVINIEYLSVPMHTWEGSRLVYYNVSSTELSICSLF